MDTLVKLEGVQEGIVSLLLKNGYFKTKAEIFRAGILGLAKEYNLLKPPEEIERELVALKIAEADREIRAGKKRVFSEREVKKKYGFK